MSRMGIVHLNILSFFISSVVVLLVDEDNYLDSSGHVATCLTNLNKLITTTGITQWAVNGKKTKSSLNSATYLYCCS